MDTTEIEKKSLEAHVELCAERYKLLELKLETVDTMAAKRNDQLIGWGIGIIGFLLSTVAYLLATFVLK